MLDAAYALPAKARGAMESYALHTGLADTWAVVGEANRYFAAAEPWARRKSDPARMESVLWTTLEVLRAVAIVAQPFVPAAAAKLLDLLGVSADARMLADVTDASALPAGAPLPAPVPIFPRWVAPEASPEAG